MRYSYISKSYFRNVNTWSHQILVHHQRSYDRNLWGPQLGQFHNSKPVLSTEVLSYLKLSPINSSPSHSTQMLQLRLVWVTAFTSLLLSRFILDLRGSATCSHDLDSIGQISVYVPVGHPSSRKGESGQRTADAVTLSTYHAPS